MTHNVWRSFSSMCRLVIFLLAACLFFASHAQAQAPTANDDMGNVNEGATANIDLAANDTNNGGGIDLTSINITNDPVNGTYIINPDGTIDYTHNGSETTTDTFTYTIDSDFMETSNVATVNVTINPVNDPPIPVADVVTLPLGSTSPINIMMLANDTDAEMDVTSLTGLGTCDPEFVINNNMTPGDPTDDSLDYTPPSMFEGTALCDYNIDDGNGGLATGTVSVTMIHMSPTCDAATAYPLWDGGIPANETLTAMSTNPAGDTATWTHDGPSPGDIQAPHPRWFMRNSSNPLQSNRGGNGGAS
ncbi:MAG: cadherin-like domain-containing protein, partial [Candidatus Tectomicrobia bacterium]|nr:cadherin-like domain-containing protein [Candidatus Tectomicrobia bacterium]